MDVFSSLFDLLQAALDTYIHGSVTKAVDYVDGPIKIIATLCVMGAGSVYILGKTVDPLSEMLKTFAIIAIVFTVAGNVGHYNEYLGNHLHDLPNDLMGVFAVGEAPTDEQGFGETMDRLRRDGHEWHQHHLVRRVRLVANRIRSVGNVSVRHLRPVRGGRLRRHGHRHGGLVPGGGHRPDHDPGPDAQAHARILHPLGQLRHPVRGPGRLRRGRPGHHDRGAQ